MNLNNLENLKNEMKSLGFDPKLSEELEKNMQKNLPEFQLRQRIAGDKGQVDIIVPIKQSGKSDYYYINNFQATLDKAKPLEDGQKYLVISPGEKGQSVFRKFDSSIEAINFFKEQKGTAELAAGKDVNYKNTLASMEKGKINFVEKEFSKAFYSPIVTQKVYVEKGIGPKAEQVANLLQGRAIYRDNLLKTSGHTFQAWQEIDFNKPKDRLDNYIVRQYHVPNYGFDLKDILDKYNIKELNDPAKREQLEESLKNGNRALITTMKDGQEIKLRIEAVPRYQQINLYQENGKPEKREQFLKEPAKEQVLAPNKGKSKEKEVKESQSLTL